MSSILGFDIDNPRAYLSAQQLSVGGILSYVLFDVMKDETLSITAEVTDHVIESGGSISDHVWVRPLDFSLKIVLTDDGKTVLGVPLPNILIEALESDMTMMDYIASIDDRVYTLKAWMNNASLLTYSSYAADYSNYVIASMSLAHNLNVGDNIELELNLKHITIAQAQSVNISFSGQVSVKTSTGGNNAVGPSKVSSTYYEAFVP